MTIGFPARTENEVVFRNERFVWFVTRTRVFALESERILIPERLTVVTHRRNLKDFQYNIIIDSFASHAAGTLMTHIDEFEANRPDGEKDDAMLSQMKATSETLLKLAQACFSGSREP